MIFTTDAARWAAITRRDAAADGHFIYAVKTTGIFCRPNCKARLARRANITFFSNSGEATSAGFRACKRCKPEISTSHDPQEESVRKGARLIEERVKEIQLGSSTVKRLDLQMIAQELGWTISHFHHVFKNRMGVTPKQFAISLQQKTPSELLNPAVYPTHHDVGVDKYDSEWNWVEKESAHFEVEFSDGHGDCADLELTRQIDAVGGHGLPGFGEEFIDWDNILCTPVS